MDSNRQLFWSLAEAEHIRARAFCRRLAGQREDGDDLYQDALISAHAGFDGLRETDSFRPWLYRIIVNTFKNRTRRPWWRRFRPLTREIRESTVGDNPVAGNAARRTLEIAFRAVTVDDRILVTLFELEGWSIAEIARLQQKSEAAIKMKLSRVRRKMREALVKHRDGKTASLDGRTELKKEKLCVAAKPSRD